MGVDPPPPCCAARAGAAGSRRLGLALQLLDLAVEENAAEGDGCAPDVLLGDWVLEHEHAGDDDHHALDAVADGVCDRGDPLEDEVGDLGEGLGGIC
jgi:hypothetical protein